MLAFVRPIIGNEISSQKIFSQKLLINTFEAEPNRRRDALATSPDDRRNATPKVTKPSPGPDKFAGIAIPSKTSAQADKTRSQRETPGTLQYVGIHALLIRCNRQRQRQTKICVHIEKMGGQTSSSRPREGGEKIYRKKSDSYCPPTRPSLVRQSMLSRPTFPIIPTIHYHKDGSFN